MKKHVQVVLLSAALSIGWVTGAARADGPTVADAARVDMQWGVKIPMRDGVQLNATVYRPSGQSPPAPCIFTLTPYIAQSYHDRGVYFAARGLPYLTVDVRGRGNSEGMFRPMIQEAQDGYDIVEWLAGRPWCNGKVAMWGGSYAGYDQWATAKELPPHLVTIVPAAAAHPGLDFPMRNQISSPYSVQWLTLTSGRAAQDRIFGDNAFWAAKNRAWFESGAPLRSFDRSVGNPSATFQEWLAHPYPDAYWDRYSPTVEQYRKMQLPILTITGSYDGDQPGALSFYREHLQASPDALARHYLVIGPWDHAGTRTPNAEFGGLKFGPASLVDLPKLHMEWYAWTMQGGPKPAFLAKPVAYYVMGTDKWRYADTLDAVTAERPAWFLDSNGGSAGDVLASGSMTADKPGKGAPDRYTYDPRDVSGAAIEAGVDPSSLIDQQIVYASRGKQLVYHSEPFAADTEISGFFKLSAWLAIDQKDTDFQAAVYDIGADGSSILLTTDLMRARYRENPRAPKLIATQAPLRYDFDRFTFVSRQIARGHRLRLVVSPVNSMYVEKNYNSGGVVADETLQDARVVNVKLYHDKAHPSALYVPMGQAGH